MNIYDDVPNEIQLQLNIYYQTINYSPFQLKSIKQQNNCNKDDFA